MSEIERLEGQVRLLKRIIERLPLCPDHRDKVRDVCCWCEMERQQRLTADLLAACKFALDYMRHIATPYDDRPGEGYDEIVVAPLVAAIAKAEGREE